MTGGEIAILILLGCGAGLVLCTIMLIILGIIAAILYLLDK